jgi:hypothetical protein
MRVARRSNSAKVGSITIDLPPCSSEAARNMMLWVPRLTSLIALLCGWTANFAVAAEQPADAPQIRRVIVDPAKLTLTGPDARYSLLVHGETNSGRLVDLTRSAEYSSSSTETSSVSTTGLVRGLADGKATIQIQAGGQTLSVPVVVRDTKVPRAFHFENDIIPIFNRFGCNSSGCHGKAEGQAGFKLSVFGHNPEVDLAALLQEGRSRRVFSLVPARSLLLTKASGGSPHGGGVRIRRGSGEHRLLRDWIAAGSPAGSDDAARLTLVRVEPSQRQLAMTTRQQLRVIAVYSDGQEKDVTQHARFQSNSEGLAKVDEFGLITAGETPGEVAIMAAYMGPVATFRALIPREGTTAGIPKRPIHNFIDTHVDAKLQQLNIAASELCTDADFLRRVSLDIIGTLPTADESRTFLADKRPDRRARLVDALLQRPEFADYWALKWSDLLRVDRLALGHKGAYEYYRWIRDSFAANKPYDRFAREFLAGDGLLSQAPAGYLHKVEKTPDKVASTVSQVFLGIRIECAQCHHHPFDRWSQTDYVGMQAFFTQVTFKPTPRGEMVVASRNTTSKHPRTKVIVHAHPLGTQNPDASPEGDRRKALAAWMTAPENPWFARNFVNRIWARFAGRGIIEPIDDLRVTNPPTNPELLDALSKSFVDSGFDFHALIRTITASRTYQLSSKPNETNLGDENNYSRALFKKLSAEVLFDAVCQTTGVGEKFDGLPNGYRAIQLWDSQVSHYFLRLFGRPERATPCECERSVEPSVGQVLHILNSPKIHAKLSHAGGQIAVLVERYPNDSRLIDELYLTFYNRFPDEAERKGAAEFLLRHGEHRQQAAEDIAWTMMNTVEFLFNH